MDRRGFLQFVCAVGVGAAIPVEFAGERIARITMPWAKDMPRLLYRTTGPLKAGRYTFSMWLGKKGLFIAGVDAKGGETMFEMVGDEPGTDPRLSSDGLHFPARAAYDFTRPQDFETVVRGEPVEKA